MYWLVLFFGDVLVQIKTATPQRYIDEAIANDNKKN